MLPPTWPGVAMARTARPPPTSNVSPPLRGVSTTCPACSLMASTSAAPAWAIRSGNAALRAAVPPLCSPKRSVRRTTRGGGPSPRRAVYGFDDSLRDILFAVAGVDERAAICSSYPIDMGGVVVIGAQGYGGHVWGDIGRHVIPPAPRLHSRQITRIFGRVVQES